MTQEDRAEGRRLLEAWEAARNDYAMRTSGLVEAADRFNEATLSLSDFLLTHARALLSDGWMPIETAPKDGTQVLLWAVPDLKRSYARDEPPHLVIAYWLERSQREIHDGFRPGWVWHGMASVEFTHWQPLPPPPEPHND